MLYIIFNPNAGRGTAGQEEQALRAALESAGLSFELVRTERKGHAEELAQAAAKAGCYSAVVAAGGDGTIHEVANGVLGHDLPLGLIPLGTGNDLVKMVDLPPNRLDLAASRLHRGTIRNIDVGVANGRVFINGLGCGLDAQTTVESLRPTRLRGFAVYLLALVRALRNYKAPTMRVEFDGQVVERRLLFATIGNGRCHGGGFWVTPTAELDDGLLDLCLVDNLSLPRIVQHVPKVIKGTHGRLKEVRMARARQIRIETSSPVAVHLDGEVLGTAIQRLDIEVKPAALPLIA